MKKKMATSLLAALAVFTMSTPALSADYTTMTTEELSNLRGTLYNATEAERNSFRNEWQKRINQMTPEELSQYTGPSKGAGKGKGKGYGGGSGMSGSQGQGQGQGKNK